MEPRFFVTDCFLFAKRGRSSPPSPNEKDLSASDCNASSDLVECRVRNLIGLNLRSSLNHFRQGSQHLRVGCVAVGLRVLFMVTQSDFHRLRTAVGDARYLIFVAYMSC